MAHLMTCQLLNFRHGGYQTGGTQMALSDRLIQIRWEREHSKDQRTIKGI